MAQSKIKILLVEDDQRSSFAIECLLSYRNPDKYEITYATSIKQAIEILQTTEQNIVLLDLNLPDSSGIQTLKTITCLFPRLAVIVLSGSTEDHIVIKTADNGGQGYISKGQVTEPILTQSIDSAIIRQKRLNEARTRFHDSVCKLEKVAFDFRDRLGENNAESGK